MAIKMHVRPLALALALAFTAGTAQAALINAGFETGDLTGWTAGPFSGAGSATVVMSNTTNYSPGDWGTPHTFFPYAGNYFLAISSGGADQWQEVRQSVALGAGQSIAGVARFDWGDYWLDVQNPAFVDGAKVEIRNSAGALVATPFYYDGSIACGGVACDDQTGNSGFETPWTPWSFTAQDADTYILVYAARNTADSGGPNQTFGYFDATVPEPGTLALLGLGLAGLAASRRRKQ